MSNNPKHCGLEIWPPIKDQSTFSVCLPVGVFSPSRTNGKTMRFHVGFLSAPEFTVSSVRTGGKCSCASYSGEHRGYPIKRSQQDDGRVYHLVEGSFMLAPEGSEMFYVTFCWNAAFKQGKTLAFTVRVQTQEGVSDWDMKFNLI